MFLKEFFENINFEKSQQTTRAWKITQHAELKMDSDKLHFGLTVPYCFLV